MDAYPSALSYPAMRKVKLFWQSVYDVRPGEGARTFLMALHMVFVLFAYYFEAGFPRTVSK